MPALPGTHYSWVDWSKFLAQGNMNVLCSFLFADFNVSKIEKRSSEMHHFSVFMFTVHKWLGKDYSDLLSSNCSPLLKSSSTYRAQISLYEPISCSTANCIRNLYHQHNYLFSATSKNRAKRSNVCLLDRLHLRLIEIIQLLFPSVTSV